MTIDVDEIQRGLILTSRTSELHIKAAVGLLFDHNNQRIVEEPVWLEEFTVVTRSGNVHVNWHRLNLALNKGPDKIPAINPFSDTERKIMVVATDLALERWGTHLFDVITREQVLKAVCNGLGL